MANSLYYVNVEATDGGFTSTVVVNVTIIDVNDNPPICTPIEINVTVDENIPIGTPVIY